MLLLSMAPATSDGIGGGVAVALDDVAAIIGGAGSGVSFGIPLLHGGGNVASGGGGIAALLAGGVGRAASSLVVVQPTIAVIGGTVTTMEQRAPLWSSTMGMAEGPTPIRQPTLLEGWRRRVPPKLR